MTQNDIIIAVMQNDIAEQNGDFHLVTVTLSHVTLCLVSELCAGYLAQLRVKLFFSLLLLLDVPCRLKQTSCQLVL